VLLVSASIAAACGGSEASGLAVRDGGLSMVPENAVAVSVLSLETKHLQRSLDTLDRLPIWGLAEGQLPKGGAEGLKKAGIDALLEGAADKKLTYTKDVKPWLGDSAGFALLGGLQTLATFEESPPILFWVDSTDDDAAEDFVKRFGGSDVETREHDGIKVYVADKAKDTAAEDGTDPGDEGAGDEGANSGFGEGAVFVDDGALVITGDFTMAKRVLDARDNDHFIDRAEVANMLDREDRDEQYASVADVNALLDLGTVALKDAADKKGTPGQDATNLKNAGELLDSKEVRDALPDLVASNGGLDERGLWFDTAWSPAGKPGIDDARKLAERMPAESMMVTAAAGNTQWLENGPKIWDRAKEIWGTDLETIGSQCPKEAAEACELGLTFATEVLEGDLLERLDEVSGDNAATAFAQTFGTAEGGGFEQTAFAVGRLEDPEGAVDLLEDGVGALEPTLAKYGLVATLERADDDATLRVKAVPAGRTAQLIAALPKEARGGFAALTGAGMELTIRKVDDTYHATAFPPEGLEPGLEAWQGDGDQITDNERYQRDIKLVDPPADASTYGWFDLSPAVLAGLAAVPEASQATPIVKTNLEKVGGVMFWSDRSGEDDEVGSVRVVIPIHEE